MNSSMLHLKAKELSSDPEFKASLGWYTNWKRRQPISMRAKTTLAQRLPAHMEEKVIEFHRFVLRSRQRCGYELSHILNMDETLMRFELPATRTLEFTGNQTVPLLSCGGNKQSFTVVLAPGVSNRWKSMIRKPIDHSIILVNWYRSSIGIDWHRTSKQMSSTLPVRSSPFLGSPGDKIGKTILIQSSQQKEYTPLHLYSNYPLARHYLSLSWVDIFY